MAKKKKQQQQQQEPKFTEKEAVTLQDQLGGDVLAKLKAAKQSLVADEEAKQAEEHARKAFERKQKEKNMSFGELFEQYGDKCSKYE